MINISKGYSQFSGHKCSGKETNKINIYHYHILRCSSSVLYCEQCGREVVYKLYRNAMCQDACIRLATCNDFCYNICNECFNETYLYRKRVDYMAFNILVTRLVPDIAILIYSIIFR